MPQLGETVTEGTITKWFKSVGEQVARDEPLFEVSTDKVDSEVPSPAEGVLSAILVEEGDTVDVGVKLAEITDGPASNGHGLRPTGRRLESRRPCPGRHRPGRSAAGRRGRRRRPAPGARPHGDPSPAIAGRGSAGDHRLRWPPRDRAWCCPRWCASCSTSTTSTRPPSTGPGWAGGSPAATSRRSSAPTGSGRLSVRARAEPAPGAEHRRSRPGFVPRRARPEGRRRDAGQQDAGQIDAGRDRVTRWSRSPTSGGARPSTWSAPKRPRPTPSWSKRSTTSGLDRSDGPTASSSKSEEGFSLSYLPFAARAAVEALAEFPHLNSSVGEDALIVHHDINLGIAVDLDNEGLIVPVVHNAEELNLLGMARRIRDLADRARNKRLSLDDISGGTFSITNAGPFGTLLTGAIINQPQVAILSTDGVARKPVVVELPDGSESIAIHSVGLAAMTFDHRAVDGAYVARFLARLSEILNDRDWAGEL